jgi:citrate lyase subunit beta/citryl-CoA lyase
MQPRRSVLYMPGANERAMEKAKNLPCDTIIFDLEDAVSPDGKENARSQVKVAIESGGYGYRELIVRCNGLDTDWGRSDVLAFAGLPISALLFPKIESLQQVEDIVAVVDEGGGQDKLVWLMVETPQGVLELADFCGHARVAALVMGTSDLVKELRAGHTPDRRNLDYALQHCVLVARRFGKEIFDGVHLDFKNEERFRQACVDGNMMGFDGKTLIHPSQVSPANEIFGYSDEDVAHAQQVLAVWHDALAAGKGVAVLDGKLVENLHAAEAERVVAWARSLVERDSPRR